MHNRKPDPKDFHSGSFEWGVQMSNPGHIYVLMNYSMENLVKVGKTNRDSESRAKELSSVTGVPTPFIVAFDAYFDDCYEAEEYVHKKLGQKGFRLSNNREFFQAPLKEVISVIVEAQSFLSSQHILSSESKTQTSQLDNEKESSVQNEKEPWSEIESVAEYYLNSAGTFEEAYRLYKQALNLGSKTAYYPLGFMTLNGLGCLEDAKEGLELLKKGVDNGDGRCCGELSDYYFHTVKDVSIGKYWFENYLESGCIINPHNLTPTYIFRRSTYIFNACASLKIALKDYKIILEKYRSILSPIKEELISFAIKKINISAKKYPNIKPLYLQIGQDIKNML